jgi:hypothetical protein
MSAFAEFCTDYFKKHFELHPTDAIYYGIEGYDHLLNDYSDETYQREKAFVDESLEKLRRIPVQDLAPDEAIDCALIEGRLTLEQYLHNKEDYRLKWPDLYVPLDAIYILTVRRTSDLAGNLLSRLDRAPDLIEQGRANLSRQAANPPRLWTEMAIEGAKGGIRFLNTLPSHPKVKDVVNAEILQPAVDKVKKAIDDFGSFLERDLLPRSRGVYAVGEEHFNLLLAKKHFLTFDAQSLLAFGESLFEQTKKSSPL